MDEQPESVLWCPNCKQEVSEPGLCPKCGGTVTVKQEGDDDAT